MSNSAKKATVDLDQISHEYHSLLELLAEDPEQNLAYKHPLIAANAKQRAYAYITSEPARPVVDPEIGGRFVNLYPNLSQKTRWNKGTFIVSHLEALETFVEWVAASARGDGSAKKSPTFIGPSGTGKTLLLDTITTVGRNLSAASPDHYLYTFEWVGLMEIPQLVPYLQLYQSLKANATGEDLSEIIEDPIESPLRESPYALLPDDYKESLGQMIKSRVEDVTGIEYRPWPYINPQDDFFRNGVIEYYRNVKKINGGDNLTPEQIVKVLSKHTRVKRYVYGSGGRNALIDNQGGNVNYSGLFFTKNVAVQQGGKGPNHPMSYFPGRVALGHGGILYLDEFLRNPAELRDVFLGVIESHRLSRDGVSMELDTLIILASNDETRVKVESEGNSKAQLNRLRFVRMAATTHPDMIGKVNLLMRGEHTMRMHPTKAEVENDHELTGKVEPGEALPLDLEKLFKYPKEIREPVIGPHGRYTLSVKGGRSQAAVHISPHALEYINMVTSITRMKTDPNEAVQFAEYAAIAIEDVYRDPMTRLRFTIREVSNVNPGTEKRLSGLLKLLKEGDAGILPRNAANIWLAEAIVVARRPEYDNTVTIAAVEEAFRNVTEQDNMEYGSAQELSRWSRYLAEVKEYLIKPRIENDVLSALGPSEEHIRDQYDELFMQLRALGQDRSATEYEDMNGQTKVIDLKTVNSVKRYYEQISNRPLDLSNLPAMEFTLVSGGAGMRDPQLMNAIRLHYSATEMAVLIQNASDAELRSAYKALAEKFGYNRTAAISAIEMVKQSSLRREIAKQRSAGQ